MSIILSCGFLVPFGPNNPNFPLNPFPFERKGQESELIVSSRASFFKIDLNITSGSAFRGMYCQFILACLSETLFAHFSQDLKSFPFK